MHMVIEGGKKISMPRYYKDKIYTDEERERIAYVHAVKAKQIMWDEMAKDENYEHNKRQKMYEQFRKAKFNQNLKDKL